MKLHQLSKPKSCESLLRSSISSSHPPRTSYGTYAGNNSLPLKAIAKTISEEYPIQISSNEWRTASQLREEYYLYICENALTNPNLITINDPFENLEKYIKKVPIEDYKMVLDQFPKEINKNP